MDLEVVHGTALWALQEWGMPVCFCENKYSNWVQGLVSDAHLKGFGFTSEQCMSLCLRIVATSSCSSL